MISQLKEFLEAAQTLKLYACMTSKLHHRFRVFYRRAALHDVISFCCKEWVVHFCLCPYPDFHELTRCWLDQIQYTALPAKPAGYQATQSFTQTTIAALWRVTSRCHHARSPINWILIVNISSSSGSLDLTNTANATEQVHSYSSHTNGNIYLRYTIPP